jgi:hypothetical protein
VVSDPGVDVGYVAAGEGAVVLVWVVGVDACVC